MDHPEQSSVTYSVHMLAYQPEYCVRPVEISMDDLVSNNLYPHPHPKSRKLEGLLDLIYMYGQNDYQPREGICSVSKGDVIEIEREEYPADFYLVKSVGFRRITPAEFEDYASTSRHDRDLYPLLLQEEEPKVVGYWAMSTDCGELNKWGLNGNSVFPYSQKEDAEKQLQYLADGGLSDLFFVTVFSNGQLKQELYDPDLTPNRVS